MDELTAREFFRFCVSILGEGFHPDTPFDSYQHVADKPAFTSFVAECLDSLMDVALGTIVLAGQDPYAVVLEIMEEER